MKELLPLTPEQLARAEEWLRNPPPGSRAAAARDFGIDLTLILRQLRLTPDERVRSMEARIRASNGGSSGSFWIVSQEAELVELEALAEIYELITPSHTAH